MSIKDNSSVNPLDLLFEYDPGLIFVHDLKGNIINMNKNLIKALGYKSKENILKLHVKDILHYENKEFKLSKYLKLVLNKSKLIEYNFKPKKDSSIPVEGFGFPYKIRNLDVIVNISNFIRDKKNLQIELLNAKSKLNELMVKMPEIRLWALSQKKSAIEILQKGGMVLKESEKKYKEILQNIKEGYFEFDLKGNIVFFNKSTCKILGYSPEELIGKSYRNFMDLETINLVDSINIEEIDDKSLEIELIKKNRVKIYIETTISKKQNTKGTLIGFYGLFRDVTKRKEVEKKIKRKLEFERIISKISSLFINPLNYDNVINTSLEYMGKLSKASRSYLFLFNNINKTMDNTHEWCAKGVTAEKENLQGLQQDMFPWWIAKLYNREFIHITDVSMMMEEAAAEQKILKQKNIMSLLVLPLYIGDILSGFLGFDNIRETGEWDEEDFFLLQISSVIIGNGLKRREISKKLKDSEQNLKNLNLELEQRINLRTKELRESEERYRNFIETTPALIQSVRPDCSFIFVNQTWLDTFGYTREEVHSLNLFDVIHPESQQHCQNLFSRIMQGESLFDIKVTYVTNDGKPIYLEGNANPYFTDDKVTATRGIFHDISERKKAEQKVKESEERYRNLFVSSPFMIVLLNTNGKIIDINPATFKYYGYKREDFIDKDFHELKTFPLKNLPIMANNFKEIFTKGFIEPIELQFYNKDRSLTWVNLQGNLVKIGDETYIQILLQDISEQKKADQKLKKSEELYHKAYDRANLYKDLFTHDINNILQTVQSSVELSFIYINESQKIKDIKRLWNLVNDQVNRGKKLVSNVRKLSQIEQTQFPLQSTEICLVLNEAIEYIQKSIQAKMINIQIDSPFKTILVPANELLLDVFENILINATRYNENPIIEILIKISKIKIDGAQFLKIEFIDNGIGITDAKKKIIFRNGFKEEKQSKGMGLGLSLVKKILDSYKGQIWVEDKIKGDFTKGSNFIILIPEE